MIRIEKISRYFGEILAVDDLSFEVGAGEVLGFLGPNGAGKSTTMKMITGFLLPSSGRISVFGHDVVRQPLQARRRIGYLPEGAPCYGDMQAGDFLHFIARVRGLRGAAARTAVHNAIERLELESVALRRIEDLSKGFKRRVGLAQAILNDPDALVLDEPTDGLDPNQKHQVRRLIRELSRDKIIVISTHILEEVSAVCSRAIIISEGRLMVDETPAELVLRSSRHNAVHLTLASARDDIRGSLSTIEGVTEAQELRPGLEYRLLARDGGFILPAVQRRLEELRVELQGIQTEPGMLDDVFRSVTRGSLA